MTANQQTEVDRARQNYSDDIAECDRKASSIRNAVRREQEACFLVLDRYADALEALTAPVKAERMPGSGDYSADFGALSSVAQSWQLAGFMTDTSWVTAVGSLEGLSDIKPAVSRIVTATDTIKTAVTATREEIWNSLAKSIECMKSHDESGFEMADPDFPEFLLNHAWGITRWIHEPQETTQQKYVWGDAESTKAALRAAMLPMSHTDGQRVQEVSWSVSGDASSGFPLLGISLGGLHMRKIVEYADGSARLVSTYQVQGGVSVGQQSAAGVTIVNGDFALAGGGEFVLGGAGIYSRTLKCSSASTARRDLQGVTPGGQWVEDSYALDLKANANSLNQVVIIGALLKEGTSGEVSYVGRADGGGEIRGKFTYDHDAAAFSGANTHDGLNYLASSDTDKNSLTIGVGVRGDGQRYVAVVVQHEEESDAKGSKPVSTSSTRSAKQGPAHTTPATKSSEGHADQVSMSRWKGRFELT